MTEIWRPVVGYETLYEVSDIGRVRSLVRIVPCYPNTKRKAGGKVLSLVFDSDGYPVVKLYKQGFSKMFKVHSLILTSFVGPRPFGLQGRHKDGVSPNSILSNLHYGTPRENWQDRKEHGRGVSGNANPNSHHMRKLRANGTHLQ